MAGASQPGQSPTDIDGRTVITTVVPVSSTLSMMTLGGIIAVGLNPRAMPPTPLLTRQAGTRTSAKLSQSQFSTPITPSGGQFSMLFHMQPAVELLR